MSSPQRNLADCVKHPTGSGLLAGRILKKDAQELVDVLCRELSFQRFSVDEIDSVFFLLDMAECRAETLYAYGLVDFAVVVAQRIEYLHEFLEQEEKIHNEGLH